MITPIPTPFDIIEPPAGAFVPSSIMWLVLALLGAIVFLSAIVSTRRRPAHSVSSLLNSLLSDLNHIRTEATSPQDLERAARLVRRIISPYLPGDAAGLSSGEMRSLADILRERKDDMTSSVAEILPLLAEVEDYAYAPSFEQNLAAAQTTLRSLCELLESHLRRYRPQ